VALFAARAGRFANDRLRRWSDRALGALFVGLGIRLALTQRP
jgi:threonine/homoserine/homoserine lactone efflux protein